MKKLKILFTISIVLVIGLYGWLKYLNHHNIVLKHPCPKLTMYVPELKQLDTYLCLTAGVTWYKVKARRTGKEYFVQFSYYWNREHINVMDAIERKRWVELSRVQYNYLFESPDCGKGYAFPYSLKEW